MAVTLLSCSNKPWKWGLDSGHIWGLGGGGGTNTFGTSPPIQQPCFELMQWVYSSQEHCSSHNGLQLYLRSVVMLALLYKNTISPWQQTNTQNKSSTIWHRKMVPYWWASKSCLSWQSISLWYGSLLFPEQKNAINPTIFKAVFEALLLCPRAR